MLRLLVINGLENLPQELISEKISICIGCFDGLHKGHMSVVRTVIADNLLPVVLSINKSKSFRILNEQTKIERLSSAGIKAIINIDLEEIRDLSPEQFYNMLVSNLNIKRISIGYNFKFGKNAEGTPLMLREHAKKKRIKMLVSAPVLYKNTPISSTRIRTAIMTGKIYDANEMLSYPFSIDSVVRHGFERGRTIGIPTLNQFFKSGTVIPKHGVYAGTVTVENIKYKCVTNIGVRPTVNGTDANAETHIIHFGGNLYGEYISVYLIDYLRDEMHFDNLEELKDAIEYDIEKAEQIIEL